MPVEVAAPAAVVYADDESEVALREEVDAINNQIYDNLNGVNNDGASGSSPQTSESFMSCSSSPKVKNLM